MTGYLRILPALPLSMAYIDSISIAELVHNVKKKKKKRKATKYKQGGTPLLLTAFSRACYDV